VRSHDRTAEAHPLRDTVLAVVLGAGAVAWAVFPGDLVVEAPSFGGPEILTPGGELEVVARVAVPWVTAIDELALESGERRVPLPLLRPPTRGARQTLLARVPQDCAPGIYDLVARAGKREARTHRSVAVLASIPERFTLAQFTDLHFGYRAAGEASVQAIVDELNRLAPAVVLVTGDIAHNGRRREYDRAQLALERLSMPFVCIPGNHDRRGWGAYLTRFGFPYRSVTFGRWTLLGLDCGHGRDEFTESQFRFIERALDAAEPGRVIVLAHIPLAGARSVRAHARTVMELFERKRAPLVLSGHWHYGAEYGTGVAAPGRAQGGTQFVVTVTAGGWLVKKPGGRRDPRGFTLIAVEDGRITSVEAHSGGVVRTPTAGAREVNP
jgi:calcineurin-like phosphoesterase family protein